MSDARDLTEEIQHHDPVLVACVVFQTQAPEHLIQKIREAITTITAQTPASPIIRRSIRFDQSRRTHG